MRKAPIPNISRFLQESKSFYVGKSSVDIFIY